MKRVIIIAFAICLILSGCGITDNNYNETEKNNGDADKSTQKMVGMWVTYSELKSMCSGETDFETCYATAIEKAKEFGINAVFVHVRAFADSVYPSKFFPQNDYSAKQGYDILHKMIEITHKNNMQFHAWINPYRVSTASADINTLADNNIAKIWRTDGDDSNDNNVLFTDSGIYFNPASTEVKKLIISGVREIVENYNVDGIHFDDYFYPTTDENFDKASYDEYKNTTESPFDLAQWRRDNVNGLILGVYTAVKSVRDIPFGISPAADLDRCYNSLYADIEGWIGGKYIDYIMPQLYFGFEYPIEKFRFDHLMTSWQSIMQHSDITLYCGLGFYKTGTETKPDSEEWCANDDIIARQIRLLDEYNWDGYVFFSYSSLFGENELNVRQRENAKKSMSVNVADKGI